MRILIVSYFAESNLYNSSTAQNTRFLAEGLLEKGNDVRVVTVGAKGETITQDGYLLTKIPFSSWQLEKRWLGMWRHSTRIQEIAKMYLENWRPDVVYMGAWQSLAEFAFAAKDQHIPIIQQVHDYSILCLRRWLIDSWGDHCDGPAYIGKCINCVRHSLDWKDRIKDGILSLPWLGHVLENNLEASSKFNKHVKAAVSDAFAYMKAYRDQTDLFIAQSETVSEVLGLAGIEQSKCKLVPQYIGEKKIRKYPRADGKAGVDRPIRIAYVGRWSPEKGVEILLEAFLSVEAKRNLELWLISWNLQREKVHAMVGNRLGSVKKISIFNNLEGAGVSEKLALTDVCIVPSTYKEVGPRIVLEANAQEVPVIASSAVGNRYVIKDGLNGKLLPSGDVDALKNCIELIVNNPQILVDWSRNVYKPIGKEEWLEKTMNVFEEAITIVEGQVN